MKAIVQDRYGSADVLEFREIDKPVVGEYDVLIRVRAAGVDRGVWHLMTGLPYLIRIMGFGFRGPKVPVQGMDVAGCVEAIGAKVTEFRVGDEVFGICAGSFAEYARAEESKIAPKPKNLSFEEAAAVPVSACTALEGLRDTGEVKEGQKVLIVGASGGVGTFAAQLAKAFGAEVTGVCSTTKVEMVRSIGADHVIDYKHEDFTQSSSRYDLILDIGGNRPLSRLRRVLTSEGTLVIVGGEEGDRWIGGIDRQLRGLLLSMFTRHKLRTFVSSESKADLLFLTELIEAEKITPVIDKTYPLSEAADAIRYLEQGKACGKIVITV